MRKTLGYALVLSGVLGLIATAIGFTYLMFLIVIWCPLQNCLPQFFVILILAGLVSWLCLFSMTKGNKLVRRRSSL